MLMLLYPEELIIQVHVDLLNTNFISLLSDLGFKITFVCPPLTGCWNRGLILFLSQVIWIQRIREMIFRILMIKISVSNFCQFVEKSGSIVLRWLETYGTVLFICKATDLLIRSLILICYSIHIWIEQHL